MYTKKLLLPLLSTPPKNHHHPKIVHPLVFLIVIGLLSLWAANESSKGFTVTVLKASETDTLAARRFNLMYVTNGKAARILIRASQLIQNHLHTELDAAEPNVRRITLQLSDQTMSSSVDVTESRNEHEYVLSLNPSLLLNHRKGNVDADVAAAILRGVTRVKMWDYHSQWGADMSVEAAEESLILKASDQVQLKQFHRLVG